MISGMSIFSAAIDLRRAFSSARAGVPGAYVLFGSLTGSGTRRTPAKAACSVTPCPDGGAITFACFSAGEVGACVDIHLLYRRGPLHPGWLTTLRSLFAARSAPFAHVAGVAGVALAFIAIMTDQKSSKGDDGRGQPAAAEQKTVEEPKRDNRLIPGGSMKAAGRPNGVSAMDH